MSILSSLSLSFLTWTIKIIVVSTLIVLSKGLNEISHQIQPAQYLHPNRAQLMLSSSWFLSCTDCKPWGSYRSSLDPKIFINTVKMFNPQDPSRPILTCQFLNRICSSTKKEKEMATQGEKNRSRKHTCAGKDSSKDGKQGGRKSQGNRCACHLSHFRSPVASSDKVIAVALISSSVIWG